MEKTFSKKKNSQIDIKIDFKSFFTLVKMLLQDKLKINFKANKKKAIIKIVSYVLTFIVLCAISYLFYFISERLNLFSVLQYVPETLPSFLSSVILLLSFISIVFGLNEVLYYSEDNRLMITYPCNGNTIFVARLFVYFISEYVRSLVIQVPLLLGYMVVMNFPVGMYLRLFVAFLFITLAEVLLASIVTIPVYYVTRFLRKNSFIKLVASSVIFIVIIALICYFIALIPSNIDIFTNWGPYFTRIQGFLNGYRSYFYGLYCLTFFAIGKLSGFTVYVFTTECWITLAVLIGTIILAFFVAMLIVNPIYFKLASSSFEFENNATFVSKRNTHRSFILSQIHKETLLFTKDPGFLLSIVSTFVFLPIVIVILNKIFGAMKTSSTGDIYIQCVNFLIITIIALNANSIIANSYSFEGSAFQYNRVYPRKNYFMLFSKLILPGCVGIISLIVTSILCGYFKNTNPGLMTLFGFATIFLYAGHMLFAAQLDFCSTTSQFSKRSESTKSEITTIILAFVVPVIFTLLFYYYLMTDFNSSFIKLFIIAAIYLAINIIIFKYRVKLDYVEGN